MSDGIVREWRFYIADMIGIAEKVLAYTDGMDQESFVASDLNYDATVRNLELIGEAVRQFRKANRQPPGDNYRQIISADIERHDGGSFR